MKQRTLDLKPLLVGGASSESTAQTAVMLLTPALFKAPSH